MIQENEVVTFLIAVGVLVFLSAGGRRLRDLPGWRLMAAAFVVHVVGLALTIAEGFLFPAALNIA